MLKDKFGKISVYTLKTKNRWWEKLKKTWINEEVYHVWNYLRFRGKLQKITKNSCVLPFTQIPYNVISLKRSINW